MGTFKLRVLEGHKACTIVQSEVLEWTKCYLWWRSFALDHVLIQFQEVCPWLAVRMKVSTQQTTSLTVVTISVLLLYFSQVSLLIGYQWRNKYNLDSHFETSTGKNKLRGKSTAVSKAWDCETSELTQIIAISALSQSWWALQYTVLLQTSLVFFQKTQRQTKWTACTWMLLFCDLLHTLLLILMMQFHLSYQRNKAPPGKIFLMSKRHSLISVVKNQVPVCMGHVICATSSCELKQDKQEEMVSWSQGLVWDGNSKDFRGRASLLSLIQSVLKLLV